jgi:hypothetical protein
VPKAIAVTVELERVQTELVELLKVIVKPLDADT